MEFNLLIEYTQVFLLVLVRVLAIMRIAPLLSSSSIPQIARIGLSFFTAVAVLPHIVAVGYPIPEQGIQYAMLLVGELMVGIVIGFFLQLIYSAFLVAGQFFSFQMGFGASQVFDPLAQVEIPLMGQFLNIVAMFVFVGIGGLRKTFLIGIQQSFEAVRAIDFVLHRDVIFKTIFSGLGYLFEQALIISFPILGTLLLVSVAMGLLAKAAPQMNLLMLGFPLKIGIAFLILFLTLPFLVEAFGRIIDASFEGVQRLMWQARGGA